MNKKLITAVMIVGLSFSSMAKEYKIGVLAKRGAAKTLKKWKTTGDYLTNKIAGDTFTIVPLKFDDVNPYIENNKVDFFLVNSSMFITAKVKYGASEVATILNATNRQNRFTF